MSTIDATFYAQVEPVWSPGGSLMSARVARVGQKRPASPIGGTVLVKLTLRMPTSAFKALEPVGVVEIPDTHAEPIKVEVVQP